jgi:KaiC/GvpD/RAD55 family RecA-like ATPase
MFKKEEKNHKKLKFKKESNRVENRKKPLEKQKRRQENKKHKSIKQFFFTKKQNRKKTENKITENDELNKKEAKRQKKQKRREEKKKERQNLTELHIKNIQKIEQLTEKINNKDSILEKFSPEIDSIIEQIDQIIINHQNPEFMSTLPFQTNFTSKQETLEKMGSIKTSKGRLLNDNVIPETKMSQLETIKTTIPEVDTSIQNNEEKLDSPLISEIDVKNKKSSRKTKQKEKDKWFFTGVEGFDQLLEKGVPAGSNIIVAGGPGCGKTIFCMQVIYNKALEGKDCVFLSMEERPDRLRDHMLEFGFKVEQLDETEEQIILRANGKGRIALKRLQPIRLARSIEALLEKASGTLPVDIDLVLDFIPEGFNAFLLALDSISAIETAFSGTKRQYRIYIEQLFRYFEDMKITTFMITESSDAPHKFSNTGVEEFLADGIFVFYNFQGVKKRTRGIEIFKLRGASHSQRIVPMNITSKGIDITPDDSVKEQSR